MGIEIIKLENAGQEIEETKTPSLAPLNFSTHHIPNPAMSIWVMTTQPGMPVMPWYKYQGRYDDDVDRLASLWSVSSEQSLFDCLFLSLLRKTAASNFYVIFPGNIRTEGWGRLSENAQSAYNRGQGCVYRLEGSYQKKLAINWVPFYQPQAIVRDPSMENFWRMFTAARTDDVANSISFFSLSNQRDLPKAMQMLMGGENDKRSEQFSEVVDWFGLYSSPVSPGYGTFATIYAKNKENLQPFASMEARFKEMAEQVRNILSANPGPSAVLSVLSRLAR